MLRFSTCLLALIFFVSSQNAFAKPDNNKQQQALIEGSQLFAFDMYRHTSKNYGNLFFSPYNIATAFAMAAAGAENSTADEMMQVLHMPTRYFPAFFALNKQLTTTTQTKTNSPVLLLANAAWAQKDLKILPSYQKTIKENFGSTIESVDFAQDPSQAIGLINQWIETQTKGKIKNILTTSDVTADTRLVLTSAIYMKAQWFRTFPESNTHKKPFHIDVKNTQDVDMMTQTANFPLYVDETVAVLELPYSSELEHGPKLAMMIALPKDMGGIAQLEEGLSSVLWHKWMNNIKTEHVRVVLPKFKITTRIELNDLMQSMGMRLAFTPKANFSGITGAPNLYISKAIHQTFIDVDEKGTEAAAATSISMNLTAILEPKEPYEFLADHPFFFMVYDKNTDVILFMGRLSKP